MVKISAFPKCWIEDISEGRMSLFEWIDIARELGCDGLEMYARFLESHEPAYIERVRSHAQAAGFVLPMMCYSPDFTVADDDSYEAEIARQKEIIRVTAELGGQYCRVLSGQNRPGLDRELALGRVVAAIERCLEEAEKRDIYLVIENHSKDGYWQYMEFAQKQEVFLEILRRIPSPRFGVQFDPSNAIVAGEDPLALLDIVAPRVMTMHASDRYLEPGTTREDLAAFDGTKGFPPGLTHGVTGRGMNDYPAICKRLAAEGFDGWISIEDGMNGMDEMRESIDFLKTMRRLYF